MRMLLLLVVLLTSATGAVMSPWAAASADAHATDVLAARLWPSFPSWPTPTSIDDETLAQLTIVLRAPGGSRDSFPVDSLVSSLQMQPGQSAAPTLGVFECCHFFTPV